MDSIDRHLVSLLRVNGRLSQEQLAREVNLSRPAVHERLKRLEEQGAIRGYTAVIDWEAWGATTDSLYLDPHNGDCSYAHLDAAWNGNRSLYRSSARFTCASACRAIAGATRARTALYLRSSP